MLNYSERHKKAVKKRQYKNYARTNMRKVYGRETRRKDRGSSLESEKIKNGKRERLE